MHLAFGRKPVAHVNSVLAAFARKQASNRFQSVWSIRDRRKTIL
jgi:hypothetical protein